MWILRLIKLLYENHLDIRDERDAIYTMLGLVTKMEKEDSVRIDLKIRYDQTEVGRSHDQELFAFEKFAPANKSMAMFMVYEKREGSVEYSGRMLFIPLLSITSIEITGMCLDLKGNARRVEARMGNFSHN